MDPTPRRRANSNDFQPPNMSGDSASGDVHSEDVGRIVRQLVELGESLNGQLEEEMERQTKRTLLVAGGAVALGSTVVLGCTSSLRQTAEVLTVAVGGAVLSAVAEAILARRGQIRNAAAGVYSTASGELHKKLKEIQEELKHLGWNTAKTLTRRRNSLEFDPLYMSADSPSTGLQDEKMERVARRLHELGDGLNEVLEMKVMERLKRTLLVNSVGGAMALGETVRATKATAAVVVSGTVFGTVAAVVFGGTVAAGVLGRTGRFGSAAAGVYSTASSEVHKKLREIQEELREMETRLKTNTG